MAIITKKMLQFLAHDIMLDLQDEELNNLSQEFDVILKQMDLVQKIDTTNVHSMHFPFDLTVNYLREDDVINVAPKTEILAAAPQKKTDYIVINKVVK
ncbi:Asp-tRNA(Asn)/Glu-tRNA(Gln) amidotransferase subunit GatC [Spiroplasma endosymbiont of Polydrusus formosus]|uniref:Asp-tRNA(Asn)/Glu-tRNA(Gln) amidotransferase subunit GatC n=1 Tax=Spiroplasma endosymbiont of Polydrusus formosus TaxID=3139326 RepID=UPI0035B5362D